MQKSAVPADAKHNPRDKSFDGLRTGRGAKYFASPFPFAKATMDKFRRRLNDPP